MALTSRITPDTIMCTYSPIPIVYTSTMSSQAGFRYKFDIYSSGSTYMIGSYVYPDQNGYGVYDASMILKPYVSVNYNLHKVTGVTYDYTNIYKYKYKVTEYIGTTSGSTTSLSVFHWVFPGVKQYGETISLSDYVMNGGNGRYFLTKWSTDWKFKVDEWASMNALSGNFGTGYNSDWSRIKITVHPTTGSNREYAIYQNMMSYSQVAQTSFTGITSLPFGPKNINSCQKFSASNSAITYSTATPIILSTDEYYDYQLQYFGDYTPSDGPPVTNTWITCSETLRVYIDSRCYKHDPTQFVWVGELGNLETFVFRMGDLKEFGIKRGDTKVQQYKVRLRGSTYSYGYDIGDRGVMNTTVNTIESHKVLSDWLEDDEATSLIELFTSSQQWVCRTISGTTYLFPIIITNKKIEEMTYKTRKLFQFEVEYDMAFEKLTTI